MIAGTVLYANWINEIKRDGLLTLVTAMMAITSTAFAGDDVNEVRATLEREMSSRHANTRLMTSSTLFVLGSAVTDLGNGYKRYAWDATGSDLGVVKEQGETIVISFPVDVHFSEIRSVSIEAEAWDVDYPEATEHDVVYFNGSSIGRLQGGNNSSHLNTFKSLSADIVKTPTISGDVVQNTFSVKVDVGNEGWVTAINWAKLTVEGREGIEVDASDGTVPEGVKVTWTSVPGATYTLYRGDTKGAVEKELASGTMLEFLDEEAEPGKVYFYTVEAFVSGGALSSGAHLSAASGESISGSNDGYYEKPPVITSIQFAKLFLTTVGPYNVKLEWNDYKEELYQVDQINFTFTGVGAANGKKQAVTWSNTSMLGREKLCAETDLFEKAGLLFPNGEHGEYKVKLKWEVTNKKTGKRVTHYYQNGEERPLEFDASDTAKVYFKKWEGSGEDCNWWKFWKRDGAINSEVAKLFQHHCTLEGYSGLFCPNSGNISISSIRPSLPASLAVKCPNVYPVKSPGWTLWVSDGAAAFGGKIKTGDGNVIGASCAEAEGVKCLGVVMAHEIKHRDLHIDKFNNRYRLDDGVDPNSLDLTAIEEYINNPANVAIVTPQFLEYYEILKKIKGEPDKYFTADRDNDGIRDAYEEGLNLGLSTSPNGGSDTHSVSQGIDAQVLRITFDDGGYWESSGNTDYRKYYKSGDNEFLARKVEEAGLSYGDENRDWGFPGGQIARKFRGIPRNDWNLVSGKKELKILEHVDASGGPVTANSVMSAKSSRRVFAFSSAGADNVKELGRILSDDWTSPTADYSAGAAVLGASEGTATGEGRNGFAELDFNVTISNRTEATCTYRVTGYLVDGNGKGVSVAYAGVGLAANAAGTATLRFAGEYINRARRNGYSLALVTVEDISTDIVSWVAAKNGVASCDRGYSYSEFAHDAIVVVGNCRDTLNGRNLDVSFDVEADANDSYTAYGLLRDSSGRTYVATATAMFGGTGRVKLSFLGDEIYTSGCEGRFVLESLQFRLADGTQIAQLWNVCETASYERSQFRPESVPLSVDNSSFTCSMSCGDDGLVDAFNICFDVANTSDEALSYRIEVNVYGTNNQYAASVSKNISIAKGDSTLSLSLDGTRIAASGVDGPYRVYDVRFTPLGETGNVERIFPDVEAMELKAKDFGAYPFKVNGAVQFYQNSIDGGYSLYVPLSILRANTVTVSAMLVDASGQFVAMATGTRTYVEPCDDGVSVRFSEHDILSSERKGPYSVRFVQIASDITGVEPLRAEVPREAMEISSSYTRYVDCYCQGIATDGYSWDTAFTDIQSAVDAANDGDLILVAGGMYEPFETYNKRIEIRAVDGYEVRVDAYGTTRCATLGRDETSTNTVLVGFLLVNGDATTDETLTLWNCGGGVCGGTVRNCRITGCTASKGGGAYCSRMENCLVDHDIASTYGGGAYGCVAVNCTIADNGVDSWCSSNGGGVYLGGCWNSIVYDNYYDNSKDYISNYAESTMYYCSTYPLPSDGEGNIESYPHFKDAPNGDYRLERDSGCIDAGLTSLAPGDYDLNHCKRVCDGIVDLGALEYQTHYYTDGECGFREYDVDGREGETLTIPVWGGHPDHTSSVKVYVVPCTATLSDLNLGKTKPPIVVKWNAGEVGTKYVKIPIKADSLAEGDESLSLVLGAASGVALTENRVIKISIEDATSNVTLAEALNNAFLKPSSSGAGKWKPVEGRRAYPNEAHQHAVFAESPAMKKGNVSTLTVGTFKGKGKLYFRFMFYGDECGYSSVTKLQAFDGKVKYTPHTAASSVNGWNSYYLDLGKGTHKVSFKVTQGAATFARVRVTDIAWIPDGKTMAAAYAYVWPEEGGVVVGDGRYPQNTKLTLKAKVRPGWHFSCWYRISDWAEVGTSATLKITAAGSESYYAMFSELNTIRTLPYPAEGGTTSGGGYYANGKTATLKAVPAKNYYLEGWYRADDGDPNKMPENWLCSCYGNANPLKIYVFEDETFFAKFLPYPKISLKTDNVKGGSVKGMGQYQPGKVATLVATPKKGYAFTGWYDDDGNLVSLSATYKYKMTADGVSFTACFKKESELAKPTLVWGDYVVEQEGANSVSTELTAGVVYSANLAVWCESMASIAKVTGLPKGLTFKGGKVEGVPTTAGAATVTVTVALGSNKKKVWTYKVRLNVADLPLFARGTFDGWSYEDDYYKRKVTVSATSAGKISVKVGSLSFSRTGWTVDDQGAYVASIREVRTLGSGYRAKKYTYVLALRLDPGAAWTQDQLSGAVATFNGNVSFADAQSAIDLWESSGMKVLVADGSLPVPLNADLWVSARRNPFGDAEKNPEAAELAAELAALGTQSLTDDEGRVWSLKVSTSGVATIARTTGTGKNKKTVSATAVVVWNGGEYVPFATFLVDGKIMEVWW